MKKLNALVFPIAALCFAGAAQAFPVSLSGINQRVADQSNNKDCNSALIPETVDGVTARMYACRIAGTGQVWGELFDGIYQHTNPAGGSGKSYVGYFFDSPMALTITLPVVHNTQASGYIVYGTDEADLVQYSIGAGFTSFTLPSLVTSTLFLGAGSNLSSAVIRFGSPPVFGLPLSPAPVSEPGGLALLLAAAIAASLATVKAKPQ